MQGAGGKKGQQLLKFLDPRNDMPNGALRTTCVFIPDNKSPEYGKHDVQPDGRCWCSIPHDESGME